MGSEGEQWRGEMRHKRLFVDSAQGRDPAWYLQAFPLSRFCVCSFLIYTRDEGVFHTVGWYKNTGFENMFAFTFYHLTPTPDRNTKDARVHVLFHRFLQYPALNQTWTVRSCIWRKKKVHLNGISIVLFRPIRGYMNRSNQWTDESEDMLGAPVSHSCSNTNCSWSKLRAQSWVEVALVV